MAKCFPWIIDHRSNFSIQTRNNVDYANTISILLFSIYLDQNWNQNIASSYACIFLPTFIALYWFRTHYYEVQSTLCQTDSYYKWLFSSHFTIFHLQSQKRPITMLTVIQRSQYGSIISTGTTSTKSKCNTNTNLSAQTVSGRAKKSYALPLLGMV